MLRKGVKIRTFPNQFASMILSRAVALVLDNIFRREKTLLILTGLKVNLLLLLTM